MAATRVPDDREVPVEAPPHAQARFVAADLATTAFRGAAPVDHRQLRSELDEVADPGVGPGLSR